MAYLSLTFAGLVVDGILKSIEAKLQGKPSKRLIGDTSFLLQ
jgi:hypothetical protein